MIIVIAILCYLGEIDRLAPQGDRILFINKAIQFYIVEANKKALRDLLKEGAIAREDRDLALAQVSLS